MTTNYNFTFGSGSENWPLPLPAQENGIQMEYFPIGVSGRTANGSYRVQHIISKWRSRVVWQGLTEAERSVVWGFYGGYIATATTVVFPNGLTIVGFVDMGSWVEAHWYDPHQDRVLYNVSFVITEA